MITTLILIAIVVILIFLGIRIYNKLILARNEFKNAFAQIDVQLTRRYELIPNLVEIAKKYMAHESQTLEAVIAARNQAHQSLKTAKLNPENSGAIKTLAGAETVLNGQLGGFMALSENYPELKANETMMQLSEELSSTENRVGFARQYFNDRATEYNNLISVVPSNIIASLFKFQEASLFEVADEKVREGVKISFD